MAVYADKVTGKIRREMVGEEKFAFPRMSESRPPGVS